ncbi:MAG TPA: hypothetical protein VIH42_14975 [Thermoguttaceae bacterium]
MIGMRLNRNQGERLFVVCQANEANIAADDVVMFELTAASVDGIKIGQPSTAGLSAVVGIADAAIANGGFGLVQCYGYRSTCKVVMTGTSVTPGHVLQAVNAADHLAYGGTIPANLSPLFVALASVATSATSATASTKIFIRCMTALLALSCMLR